MLETLAKFWAANSAAILISIVTGFLFFVLGPIGVWFSGKKIRRERTRKSIESLLDLVEGMLVSGEAIDATKVSTLFRGVERENSVDLEDSYDTDSLFDDLTLRFAKSRHLDPNQKNKYGETVEALRESIRKAREARSEKPAPISHAKLFEGLRAEIMKGDKARALGFLAHLQDKIVRERDADSYNPFRSYLRIYRRNPRVAITVTVLTLILYGFMIQTFILSKDKNRPNQTLQGTPGTVPSSSTEPEARRP